jgi:hypothetical protein
MSTKLKFWRFELGLSQVELSAVSGVPRHLISLHEQLGAPLGEEHKKRLASALGKQLKEIFPVSQDSQERGTR